MTPNPILEEIWRIKEQLAAEAGNDFDVFFDQLLDWSRKNADLIRRVQAGAPLASIPDAPEQHAEKADRGP